MNKEKLKIGLLYLGLHNQLKKKYGINHYVTRKELFCKLGKHSQIPNSLRDYVIKEMVEKKLLERIRENEFKILPYEIDIETEHNKLYNIFVNGTKL